MHVCSHVASFSIRGLEPNRWLGVPRTGSPPSILHNHRFNSKSEPPGSNKDQGPQSARASSPAVESKHLPRNMPSLFGLRVRRPLSSPSNPKLGARLVQEAQTKRELANVPYLVHPNPQRPRGTRQLTLKTKTKNHQKELGADADFKEKCNYKKLLGVDQIVSSTPPSAHSRPCQGRPFGCAASEHPTRTAPRGGSARSSAKCIEISRWFKVAREKPSPIWFLLRESPSGLCPTSWVIPLSTSKMWAAYCFHGACLLSLEHPTLP